MTHFSSLASSQTLAVFSLVGLMTQRERRTYDHRVNSQVIAARNPDLFPELEIPHSVALSWIRRGLGNVVSIDELGQTDAHFLERIAKLERRVSMLTAVPRLVLALLHLSGFKLDHDRAAKTSKAILET